MRRLRPFLVRRRARKPLLRFLTRCDGSKVSLLGPLACKRVRVVEGLGRRGNSRVVESDNVEVGADGSVGRVADKSEIVRLRSSVSRWAFTVGGRRDMRLCGLQCRQWAKSRLQQRGRRETECRARLHNAPSTAQTQHCGRRAVWCELKLYQSTMPARARVGRLGRLSLQPVGTDLEYFSRPYSKSVFDAAS